MSRRRNQAMRIALAVSDARHDEAIILRRNRFADEDRRFAEALARSAAADARCLVALDELASIRIGESR